MALRYLPQVYHFTISHFMSHHGAVELALVMPSNLKNPPSSWILLRLASRWAASACGSLNSNLELPSHRENGQSV